MMQCWKEDPQQRPQFAELVDAFNNMLQIGMDYLDLNSLVVTNTEYFMTDDQISPGNCHFCISPSQTTTICPKAKYG